MEKMYRVTLWSGGKSVMVYYVAKAPQLGNGMCSIETDEGHHVILSGVFSVEEGVFSERPISLRGMGR